MKINDNTDNEVPSKLTKWMHSEIGHKNGVFWKM